jgi:exonuclease SbcC
MHVTRVELENIKSYEHADFPFQRGTTAITGENGAGKTTILEAIAWALFDTLEYNKEDFLRRGAKRGLVRVTFESDVDDRQYIVYRDTANGYYIHDPGLGMRIAEKKADVSSMLRKLLGIEPGTDIKSLFRSAIGVAQGTFTAEFLLPANQRKAAFDRLLKVEEYRESADRLRETVSLINERIAEARERIAGDEGKLAGYDEQVAEQKEAVRLRTELEERIGELKREIEERANEVQCLERAEADVNEARSLLTKLEVALEATVRRLNEAAAERDIALAALQKRNEAEPGHLKHLSALEKIQSLEKLRVERDLLRSEQLRIEGMVAAANRDRHRLNEAVERSLEAQQALEGLTGEIAEQESLEKERERLRDLRARALSERERLAKIDSELAALRKAHSLVKAEAKAAEGCEGARERAEKLESERLGIETALSDAEKASTSLTHLRSQRAGEEREVERLKKEIAAREKEISRLEKMASNALEVTQLASREHELVEQLAKLRAEIARDERFHAEVKNGLCPILSERCLNIGEGQTLEDYFKASFAINSEQLRSLEQEHSKVTVAAKSAREAEKHLARIEDAHRQLGLERKLLSDHESLVTRLDAEIAGLTDGLPEKLKSLRLQLFGIDGELKTARTEALKYAGLEPLLKRLTEIEHEGKARRDERESVAAAAMAVETLETELAESERRLTSLKDPRSKAAALRVDSNALETRRLELEGAEDAFKKLSDESEATGKELQRFTELDSGLLAAAAERDETAASHRDFITAETLAATLPAREEGVRQAAEEAAQTAAVEEAARSKLEAAIASYDRDRHAAARSALASGRELAAATTAQLDAARLRESDLATKIARLDEIRALMREQFKSKERLERLRESTEFIRDTLKTAGPLVTESYLYNISVEANQLFREITGEAGRTLRWTRDYEIMIEEEGHERSFQNLSGGEQMAAALSVRLALLKQLSDIRLAFFDEPTVNMDSERRERLAQQIGHIQHFDQLFVISHDDTFEESVDHILHVARNNNGSAVVGGV